jgi:hypothetical protein
MEDYEDALARELTWSQYNWEGLVLDKEGDY